MQNAYLLEEEVRRRLEHRSKDEIEDMYSFGQKLADEALERVRSVEHKATFFAAYGSAVITLLASTFPKWDDLGNRHAMWIAACSGLCAFLCTWSSVSVLRLKQGEFISEAEWLNTDCGDVLTLKKFRIVTLWATIDSRFKGQSSKARHLQRAEIALAFSGLFLVYLLVQFAFLQTFWHSIESLHWNTHGNFFAYSIIGDAVTFLALSGTLLWLFALLWRMRRI